MGLALTAICYRPRMCRSIKTLRPVGTEASPATDAEIEAAALQFVRKVSGYRQPSAANADAFDAAVEAVAESTRRLLGELRPGFRAAAPRAR